MKSILDPTFRYVSSHHTDLRKTFARVRRENARVKAAAAKPVQSPAVASIFPRRSQS